MSFRTWTPVPWCQRVTSAAGKGRLLIGWECDQDLFSWFSWWRSCIDFKKTPNAFSEPVSVSGLYFCYPAVYMCTPVLPDMWTFCLGFPLCIRLLSGFELCSPPLASSKPFLVWVSVLLKWTSCWCLNLGPVPQVLIDANMTSYIRLPGPQGVTYLFRLSVSWPHTLAHWIGSGYFCLCSAFINISLLGDELMSPGSLIATSQLFFLTHFFCATSQAVNHIRHKHSGLF